MDYGIGPTEIRDRYHFWSGARYAAEEIGMYFGFLIGWVVKSELQSWWLAVPAGVISWWMLIRYFGSREEAAEEAFCSLRKRNDEDEGED